MKQLSLAVALGCLVVLMLSLPAVAAEEPALRDVRVIIDVSGSMKQNDPANLRVPAMELLIGLLPEDTRSGVWLFGQYVNMIVKPGLANKAWKKKALLATSKIHSRGMYTNIEDALNKATWDWKTAEPEQQRSIILLTDGVVDVSKNKKPNDDSRARILTDVLPRLQENGVVLHTIALSENADLELLKLMSVSTDGWQETVHDADHLQRIFLRMFEKTIKPDTVPLKGNRFSVDNSIKELTVLAFTRKESEPVALISPGGTRYMKKDHPRSIRWQDSTGYAMVTVDAPLPGEWQLQADIDPDNRVMIVTDLKLKVSELPNHLLAGERLSVSAWLQESNATITRPDFLQLVDMQLKRKPAKGDSLDTAFPKASKKGVYQLDIDDKLSAGRYEIVTQASSKTFQREERHSLQVHDSPVETEVVEDQEQFTASIILKASDEIVNLENTHFSATITAPDKSIQDIEIQNPESGLWQIGLKDLTPGQHSVQVYASGTTAQDRAFDITLPVIMVGKPVEAVAAEETPPPEPPAEEEQSEMDMMTTGIIIAASNLLLIIPGIVVFIVWRKRRNLNRKTTTEVINDEGDSE